MSQHQVELLAVAVSGFALGFFVCGMLCRWAVARSRKSDLHYAAGGPSGPPPKIHGITAAQMKARAKRARRGHDH